MIHGFLRWTGAVPAARGLVDALCAATKPLLHRHKHPTSASK
jgi:hypothetical protein